MGRGPTKEYYKVMNQNYTEGTLTCLRPGVLKKKVTNEGPLVLNIEPTNDCNSHCFYCPRKKTVGTQGINYLAMDDFKKIIDQIHTKKLIMLNLHKDGEPLLHKDLPQMVAYAKQKDAAQVIHLNTNGILINSKIGRGIIKKGIDDITISVDAALEKTYYRFKKMKGLHKLEEDIKEIIEYRDKINSRTNIRLKIMEFDDIEKEEIDLFYEKWSGVADEVQVTGIHSWSGAIDIKVTDEQSHKRYPCALLWYMLAINSNGKVSICNVDWNYSGVIGNINSETIHDIWNGKKLRNIRRAQLKGIWNFPPICEKCVVWVSVGNLREFLRTKIEFI